MTRMQLSTSILPLALALTLPALTPASLPAQNPAPLLTLVTFAPLNDDDSGTNTDAANPESGLVQGSDGSFYGTASNGGAHASGAIFRLIPGSSFTVPYVFSATNDNGTNTDGAHPRGGLIQGKDGKFYGTTEDGGAHGRGVVFRYTPGGTLQTLHSFADIDHTTGANTDGAYAVDRLSLGSDGFLYGVTGGGGANGTGTVFRLAPDGTFTSLYSFSARGDDGVNQEGTFPHGPLVEGADGTFYGVTAGGGNNNAGTVFRFSLAGGVASVQAIYSFSQFSSEDPNGGGSPLSGLILGKDGSFYGTTSQGGFPETGTVFRITPAGQLTTLHKFSNVANDDENSDGANPSGALVQGKDGNFYGTASRGGANGLGTVFGLAPDGSFTTFHSFASNEGAYPVGGLIQATDGNFYGTTYGGGSGGTGTVFRINLVNPVITSAATAAATAGQPFSYQIKATRNPTKFAAARLPAGLSLNANTGKISGSPQQPGTYTAVIAASNAYGSSSATLKITVQNPVIQAPQITSATSASGTAGRTFSYQITASNNPTKYGAANLPSGLMIDQGTGKITGMPTAAGTYTATIAAFNSAGSGQAKLTITVRVGSPVITSPTTASASLGKAFTYQITATNSPNNYGASGLPAGLTIDQATGKITGTPTKAGTYTATVAAFNDTGNGTAKLTITVK